MENMVRDDAGEIRRRAVFHALMAMVLVGGAACRSSERSDPGCRAPVLPSRSLPMALERVFGELTFTKPVQLLHSPAEPGTWLVALHTGVVERVRDGSKSIYFDISDRVEVGQQWGLHEIALHPRFPEDPRIFIAYVAPNQVSVVSSLRASPDGRTVDTASETVLLSEAQERPWHPIAGLKFGPDGYLYVAWGEGGGKSQRPTLLGGKMLRIDVDRNAEGRPYAIPPDNPYLGTPFRPETFAIGLRNPWRFSFDRETGDIWLGDVGDRTYEEINRIVAGGNYGFPAWEGTGCMKPAECSDESVKRPVVQHSHSEMCSVTGGYVYRGRALPSLRGRYVYANFCSGTVWALREDESGATVSELIASNVRSIGSFAEDPDGELYAIETRDTPEDDEKVQSGFMAYRLVANEAAVETPSAELQAQPLSQAQCVSDLGFSAAPEGMIAYSINLGAWADGTETLRFVSRRSGGEIYGAQDALERPSHSIVMKTFVRSGRPVETQLLVKRKDRTWAALDYEWDDDARDARPLARGKTKLLQDGMTWTFPGPEGCHRCHHTQIGSLRALTLSQLAGTVDGRDQLDWLTEQGVLQWRKEEYVPPTSMPKLDDESIPIEQRARAYLDVNCSACHQPGGFAGEATMDLRRKTPLAAAGICGKPPNAIFPGHEDAALLAPGAPDRSLISLRMHLETGGAMPPERQRVDPLGTRIIDAWISSLAACQ
jgi:glucose/arabinose dehydrogenase